MENNQKTHKDFVKFLENVPLDHYRDLYKPIKIVEMDLSRDIQALDIIYEFYWDKQEFLNYENFYKKYEL